MSLSGPTRAFFSTDISVGTRPNVHKVNGTNTAASVDNVICKGGAPGGEAPRRDGRTRPRAANSRGAADELQRTPVHGVRRVLPRLDQHHGELPGVHGVRVRYAKRLRAAGLGRLQRLRGLLRRTRRPREAGRLRPLRVRQVRRRGQHAALPGRSVRLQPYNSGRLVLGNVREAVLDAPVRKVLAESLCQAGTLLARTARASCITTGCTRPHTTSVVSIVRYSTYCKSH